VIKTDYNQFSPTRSKQKENNGKTKNKKKPLSSRLQNPCCILVSDGQSGGWQRICGEKDPGKGVSN